LTDENTKNFAATNLLLAVVGAWLGYLVVDFLLHAVFLANWWRATETFWLPPSELFQRIPLGYTSFIIYCFALTWLISRLYNNDINPIKGIRFGAIAGIISSIVFVLGTYSVFPMPPVAFILWPLSSVLESTVAGGIAAWILIAEHPWRRIAKVLGVSIVFFILGVLIQNF
jgi:hypothetical protein